MKPTTQIRSCMACCVLLLVAATQVSAQRADAPQRTARTAAATARGAAHVTRSVFAQDQLRYSRVRTAQRTASPRIHRMFEAQGIRSPAAQVYLRAFKHERALELWVKPAGEAHFKLLKTYEICALAGEPGPKRRQGDEQVPEGFYTIDLFNPVSSYHLSLRIDYPNQRDRIANRGRRMGGDIFIHGGCKSIGCLAVTDAGIQEIYWIAVEARALGQRAIPVHIFPARPGSDRMERMRAHYANRPELLDFWASLRPGYEYFEQTRRLPRVSVDARGRYRVTAIDG